MPLHDDMIEQKIENISVVFCLIDDKDIFKKYYSKFLAKRLIKVKSASFMSDRFLYAAHRCFVVDLTFIFM